jgi:ribosomal protein S18 acetylase RimI-like enzyme
MSQNFYRPQNVSFARVSDAQEVHSILWSARNEIPLNANFNSPEHIEWTRDACKNRYFYVCKMDGNIAGIMKFFGNEIFYLVVAETYRRRGVARSLIAYAKYRYSTLWAKTKENNAKTITLLTSEGFKLNYIRTTQPGWIAYSWPHSSV